MSTKTPNILFIDAPAYAEVVKELKTVWRRSQDKIVNKSYKN